ARAPPPPAAGSPRRSPPLVVILEPAPSGSAAVRRGGTSMSPLHVYEASGPQTTCEPGHQGKLRAAGSALPVGCGRRGLTAALLRQIAMVGFANLGGIVIIDKRQKRVAFAARDL